jgi:hypothetical protein
MTNTFARIRDTAAMSTISIQVVLNNQMNARRRTKPQALEYYLLFTPVTS